MADQENQNQAEGEVVVADSGPAEPAAVEEQNNPGDESNNQGAEEQTDEVATKDDEGAAEDTPAEENEPTPETEQAANVEPDQVDATENLPDEANDQEATPDKKEEDANEDKDKEEVAADQVAEGDASQNADADPSDEPKAEEPAAEEAQQPVEDGVENKPAVEEEGEEPTVVQADAAAEEIAEPEPETPAAPTEEPAAAPSAEQEAPPPEEQAPPAEEQAPPAEEQSPPAEEQAPPIEEQAPPAEEQAPPIEEQVPPTEEQVPPTEEQVPPTEEQVPPTEEQVPSNEEQVPPTEEQVPPTEEDAPAPEQEAVAAENVAETAAAAEEPEETTQEQTEEPESQQPEEQEPVQVETSVKEGPPGSPKVAMEEERKPRTPRVNLDATATVKFVLMPSGQVVTLACTLGQTLESLKSHFAMELKMASSLIMIMFDGKNMSDTTTLADLGVGPNGTVQLEMQSADPVNTPLKPYRPRQEYHMPDVITVRVMTEDGESKDVVVEIERSRVKKPFLGGFRNKNSGVEFHNAAAQTAKKPRPPPTVERYCRDTQTCEQKNTRQQTTNTTSTQMTGIGVYVTNMEDKLVTPGKYFSADEHCDMILRNVIILQKYYRRWLAKRYVTKLQEDKAMRLAWERQEELRKKREKEERIKRDYARRLNPKTKADFDMLLNCLEKWRQEEMERINSTLTGAERKAALCMLLDQETELLSAIERHKNDANQDNRDNRIIAFLEKAAAPKKWQGHDGKLTYMDTPFTIRAKELRDIYNSINMKYLTQDERLDVLLTLKHTVKEHDCKLTQEIIELIDREADLLMRGVKEGNLTGLRKRISTLFLQYIKTPTFNPEAARLLKVPQDPSTLRKNINYCHSCGRYLPSTEFFITSNSKQVGRCRNCMKVENDGRQREDYTFYRVMLKALRKSEESMQDGSSICYLLQENDLRYLVENIWSNQSVLSAWDDLYDLVLVRWDKHQEWSPWNCILLTHDEAEAHQKLFSLEEGYGQVFIHKVTQKHNFARNYFSRLPGMAELLRQKVGNRDLINNSNGPAVSGHTVAKAQKV